MATTGNLRRMLGIDGSVRMLRSSRRRNLAVIEQLDTRIFLSADVTGFWQGTKTAQGPNVTPPVSNYLVTLNLTQTGTAVTGTEEIVVTAVPTSYADYTLTGTVTGNTFKLTDKTLTQFVNPPGAKWLFPTYTLTVSTDGSAMSGPWSGPAGDTGVFSVTKVLPAAPTISTQPMAQSVTAGNSVSFTAASNGAPTPTVQWQISTNGTTFSDVPGATAITYTSSAAAAQNGDLFRAVFTNSLGSATTNSARLTVTPAPAAPVVTTQPVNKTIGAGSSVSFTAAASGVPAPTVQWQISTDGVTFNDIPGAASTTYTFAASAAQNGDSFRAFFTNSQGTGTSTAALLTVNAAPAITTQPLSQSTTPGQNVAFIAAASGNPAPTVQWQISTDGTTFNNIAGATAATYSVAPALGQNSNQFRAVFTNSQGTATTNPAILAVSVAPTAPLITTQPGNQSVQAGQSATFTAAAGGNPTPTIQWQVSMNGAAFVDVPGATSATYSLTSALVDNGYLFRAVFANSQGTATSNAAELTVSAVPAAPTITTQPTDQHVPAGQLVSFTAGAIGSPAPSVQWQVSNDGTTFNDVPGATFATYAFSMTAGQDGDQFRAVFTNSQGSATTEPATLRLLTVGASPSPAVPTLGSVSLPAAPVIGVRFNGKVPVIITNTGGTSLTGNFVVNVFASANAVLDGTQTLLTTVKSHFTLKPTKLKKLMARIRSFPAGLTPGAYYVVTQIVDPSGATNTTATAQPLQLEAARITLNVAPSDVVPASISPGRSGSISVTITNTGNVPAAGPLALALSPSVDGVNPVAQVTLAQINGKRVHIAPGKFVKIKLHFKVTAATITATFVPYVSVSVAGATQTAVGTTPFAIGAI